MSSSTGSSSGRSTSGAPRSQAEVVPSPSLKEAPLYLRAEEKGRDCEQRHSSLSG
ncbi:hypothetical protein SALBM135S_05867 [Streptomyces alboniger]